MLFSRSISSRFVRLGNCLFGGKFSTPIIRGEARTLLILPVAKKFWFQNDESFYPIRHRPLLIASCKDCDIWIPLDLFDVCELHVAVSGHEQHVVVIAESDDRHILYTLRCFSTHGLKTGLLCEADAFVACFLKSLPIGF